MNKRVLILSSAYMCLNAEFQAMPDVSQKTDGSGYETEPGGTGIVSAVTFKALGLDSIFCSALAEDLYGKEILKLLDTVGVDRRFVKRCRAENTCLDLTLCEQGLSGRGIKFNRIMKKLSYEDVEAAFMVYPDALYIQNEVPYELASFAVNLAKKKNVKIFWQPCAKRRKEFPELPAELEISLFHAREVYSYCGVEPDGYDKFLSAAMALSSRIHSRFFAIRLPERGTFLYDGIHHDIAAEFAADTVDERGAEAVWGAAFVSAYLMTDGNLKKAARCAAAAYAYSSSNKGELASVPSAVDLAVYLKKE